ncbi:MAG: SDR family oxidoreductase, partial [Myxococcales bacterium]
MGFDLKEKVVFITGASSGIGEAAARAYAAAGARVVAAARHTNRLEELVRGLERKGHEAIALPCDVRSDESVKEAIDTAARRFGGLDVLVNNAGVGLYGLVEELTPEKLQENFDINVYGVLRGVRAVLPHLRRRGSGQIVNVSSVLGHRALPGMGGYCASKFALNALTESMRAELAKDHIDVILVSPGLTATEFRQSAMTAAGKRESRAPSKPMTADEVAKAMVKASRRRQREVILTLSGRAMVEINRFAPSLFDKVALKMVGPTEP